jgi:capsular polysaccharide transport system permease protein
MIHHDVALGSVEAVSTGPPLAEGYTLGVHTTEKKDRETRRNPRLAAVEVTDTEKSRSEVLSRAMGLYEHLESERTFAEKAYQHALESLDRSRMNADRQQVYIAGFVQPSLPEESLYPRRLRSFGVVFVLCFAVWGIGGIALKSVRDHL